MKLTYIFVHGLSGWGSYEDQYHRMPYWGMNGGDLMVFLRSMGYACYAASVSPTGSAWDRACELYAQLSGTQTDYGIVHSHTYQHDRFGRDFSRRSLIPYWDEETRLVLIGHSFGGATVRLFAELLANGDPVEKKTSDVSPFFAGGMADRIHSVVTLSAPTNGTTAYDLFEDPSFDPSSIKVPLRHRILARMMSMGTSPKKDGRDVRDYAGYDMHIDNALAMNARIATLPTVYYFSVPCCATTMQEDGTQAPDKSMEPLFKMRSRQIGCYTGKTKGGFVIDASWQENDGLVNTVSSIAPLHAPKKPLDPDHIEPGIWNVFPTLHEDHMWLQGGLVHTHDIRDFYLNLLQIIEKTPH
ncbi:MAG: hypothetical protein IKS37_01555 [Solobacterium sp.]|nr:hypothetical protein [Solobacterium sp.]